MFSMKQKLLLSKKVKFSEHSTYQASGSKTEYSCGEVVSGKLERITRR